MYAALPKVDPSLQKETNRATMSTFVDLYQPHPATYSYEPLCKHDDTTPSLSPRLKAPFRSFGARRLPAFAIMRSLIILNALSSLVSSQLTQDTINSIVGDAAEQAGIPEYGF